MGVYVITNQKGSYIHKDSNSGKYVSTKNLKEAAQWSSFVFANKILSNSISKRMREDYTVQLISTDKIVEKNNISIWNDIGVRNVTNDNISEYYFNISNFINYLSCYNDRLKELQTELSMVDKKIVDVEHYIEFGNFNAYQGWMCFKMLQNLLRQRRNYKNEIEVIQLINQSFTNKNSFMALPQRISEIKNKCYTPRAVPELFKIG